MTSSNRDLHIQAIHMYMIENNHYTLDGLKEMLVSANAPHSTIEYLDNRIAKNTAKGLILYFMDRPSEYPGVVAQNPLLFPEEHKELTTSKQTHQLSLVLYIDGESTYESYPLPTNPSEWIKFYNETPTPQQVYRSNRGWDKSEDPFRDTPYFTHEYKIEMVEL